jgi:thymidylate kinase
MESAEEKIKIAEATLPQVSTPGILAPPRGMCIVMMGPDGVGKSTMRVHLLQRLGPLFRNTKSYHFRPRVIGRIGPGRPIQQPHSMKPRGRISSVLYLLVIFVDYWLGYMLHIRPLLKDSSLIVLDRYFVDILIDPVRYRYGGPMWLAHCLQWLIPPRDVFFLVLDADEHVIYSRKTELPFNEVVRQRQAYVDWAKTHSNSLVVRTECGAEECAAEAVRGILKYLNATCNQPQDCSAPMKIDAAAGKS